jgi:hypothetical protein
MTSTLPKGTFGSVASLLAATFFPWNPDRNHKLWNIVSSERDILHIQVPSRSTVRVGKERNFTTTEIISVFPL